MKPGYIYVLQNKAYGSYVVKIGLTTREPSIRAREIYAGSTGVPMPFDVAVAYSVADCERAEKQIHRRLATYRLNLRREFFRLSPSVAASITYESCAQVNAELAASPPRPFLFSSATTALRKPNNVADFDHDVADGKPIELLDPRTLAESPAGTSNLTAEQLDRARILSMNLGRVNPVAQKTWLEGFSRDEHPERELRIWEHIAKAYLTVDGVEVASEDLKKEAFELLLSRSWYSTAKVLEEAKFKLFTHKTAKRLLGAYELRPKPLVIRRGRSAG
jgi:hypothetical protein